MLFRLVCVVHRVECRGEEVERRVEVVEREERRLEYDAFDSFPPPEGVLCGDVQREM